MARINQTNTSEKQIEIITLLPEDDNFQLFTDTPASIHPYYRYQLAEKNQINFEFLHKCLVLRDEGKAVGRLAIYINPNVKPDGVLSAGIGNYECIHNEKVSALMLSKAEEIIREAGITQMIGPFNGSIWDDYRFSEYHKNEGFFMEPYHPIYYKEQFKSYGFKPLSKYISRVNTHLKKTLSALETSTRAMDFESRGITFRNLNMEEFQKELSRIHEFCMEAFKGMYLFSPISQDGFFRIYMPAKSSIDPGFVFLAEDSEGQITGMIFAVIDFLHTDNKRLIIRTLGRSADESLRGLGMYLSKLIYQKAINEGYHSIIHAFMNFNEGTSQNSVLLGEEEFQVYTLYSKMIGQ